MPHITTRTHTDGDGNTVVTIVFGRAGGGVMRERHTATDAPLPHSPSLTPLTQREARDAFARLRIWILGCALAASSVSTLVSLWGR